jgi:deazaflavin-dependent oxidoreductase (nitroreductase family)
VSLPEHPLPRWGKQVARLPLVLYRLGMGRLLGHRFLVIVHRGRRSGRLYQTVVEVVRWDRARAEAVVASGWGETASWWRNLQAAPAVEVWLGGDRFQPEQRFLDLNERIEILDGYRREHPQATRLLGPLLGIGQNGSLAEAASRLPMVAFRRRQLRPRYLTAAEAGRVYDRIGRIQDLQALYEHRATGELLAHGDFEQARSVFELGYGTGAFAQRLLEEHVPSGSRYLGIDVSPRMQELARRRLRRFERRAELRLGDGSLHLPFDTGAFDRVIANYVLDLLSPGDIELFLREAHRLLAPDGLLCLTSLTEGRTGPARLVTRAWQSVSALRLELVGGCRPVRLTEYLAPDRWALHFHTVVSTLGISSEVVVAASRR